MVGTAVGVCVGSGVGRLVGLGVAVTTHERPASITAAGDWSSWQQGKRGSPTPQGHYWS